MTDKQQPEALALADICEDESRSNPDDYRWKAAAYLRRQQAELETLRAKIKTYEDLGGAADDVQILRMGYAAARLEIESLKAQLAAPQGPVNAYGLLANVLEAYEGIPINMRTRGDTGLPFDNKVAAAFKVLQAALAAGQVRASHGQAPAGESLRTDALCDLSYSHGLKAGWNYCASDDLAGFERAQKIGAEALRTLKSPTAQASPAAVAGPHVTDAMALAFHHALGDGAIGSDEVEEIKAGLRAALAAAPTTQPAPQQEAQEPVAGHCRFPGGAWAECSPEHVRMVRANPEEWKGYEVRYLYAEPQPSPAAQGDALDAARWHWLAGYLVGPRTDLDDEIVASETVNDLRNLVDAARAAQEGK